jgi:hypothetical protein
MWDRSALAPGLAVLLSAALLLACSLPGAARRSSDTLKEGWDVDAKGLGVLVTGPGATLLAAGGLAFYSVVPTEDPAVEPPVKWFRFYDGPMKSAEQVAILCHLDRATHVATIRRLDDPVPTPARYQEWHYPACIEALAGEYELTVSYYSRQTVEAGLSATTTTSESTTDSTTRWIAESGSVYVLGAVVGEPAVAPGSGPTYKLRRRSKELWDTRFKLEVSHWKAAIVKLPPSAQLDLPIQGHREVWRKHESVN